MASAAAAAAAATTATVDLVALAAQQAQLPLLFASLEDVDLRFSLSHTDSWLPMSPLPSVAAASMSRKGSAAGADDAGTGPSAAGKAGARPGASPAQQKQPAAATQAQQPKLPKAPAAYEASLQALLSAVAAAEASLQELRRAVHPVQSRNSGSGGLSTSDSAEAKLLRQYEEAVAGAASRLTLLAGQALGGAQPAGVGAAGTAQAKQSPFSSQANTPRTLADAPPQVQASASPVCHPVLAQVAAAGAGAALSKRMPSHGSGSMSLSGDIAMEEVVAEVAKRLEAQLASRLGSMLQAQLGAASAGSS